MKRISNIAKAILTTGKDHQAFIGARWILLLLWITPRRLKRNMALRILSVSPHYFYREFTPEYKNLSLNLFLEAEYKRNRSSREMICTQLLMPFIKPNYQILDIGCGPGFLAKAVARHARTVYACDISLGVLECARILNNAENIKYIYSSETGFNRIEDSSLDLVYSIAVIQHLRECVIKYIFSMASRKLRIGGRCLFQVQLQNVKWKNENEWVEDKSLTGRLKLKYALNCFARSEGFFREIASQAGLSLVAVHSLSEMFDSPFDDVYYQHLIILSKPHAG
jgi:ubiquinone/menaquinone biosynthesis C-methylase UbiE